MRKALDWLEAIEDETCSRVWPEHIGTNDNTVADAMSHLDSQKAKAALEKQGWQMQECSGREPLKFQGEWCALKECMRRMERDIRGAISKADRSRKTVES